MNGILMIVLRLIHIVAGVFWVGGGMLSAFFIAPAAAATGEAGQKMMAYMVSKGRITTRMTVAAILTVLAGAVLYWIDSGGLTSPWTVSPVGIGFALGGLLALVGLGLGMMVGRSSQAIGAIAAAARGNPTPEQVAAMQAAQKSLSSFSLLSTVALILALACMATARYWGS